MNNKNILLVSPSFNPLDGVGWGSTQRTNLLFEACTQLGHVDVISFVDGVESNRDDCTVLYSESAPKANMKEGRAIKFIRMLTPLNPYAMFPKNKRCAEIVRGFVKQGNYDFIVCRYIPEAMMCGLFDYADKLVIDVDDSPCDVERTAERTSRTWRNRMYHRYRTTIIEKVVDRIQRACYFTFYANPSQATYKNSAYLPNIPFYEYDLPLVEYAKTNPRLLFVGNMSYGPNAQGIDKFIDSVFFLIRQQIPNVELHLVGGCNQQAYLDKWSKMDGVRYMGFVDDLKQEYEEARVVVAPIYDGAGTNIKVLEAMKMKRPCVTTTFGFRGFSKDLHHGVELLVSQDDKEFAANVIVVLTHEAVNHEMSEKAYKVVSDRFSRSAFYEIVVNCLTK